MVTLKFDVPITADPFSLKGVSVTGDDAGRMRENHFLKFMLYCFQIVPV